MSGYKHYDLVKNPIITEKTTALGELGKYVFQVASNADKNSIKIAIEKLFSVKVRKVNILILKGKSKRFKGIVGKRVDRKKAIVTLSEGSTIDYSGGIK